MRRFLRLCPLLVCVLVTTPASGQSAADKAAARALADEADAALLSKNFGTAGEKFQKALGLVPDALTLRLGLARAQAGVGKYLEATESYNLIIRTPLTAASPAPFRAAQKDAEREIADTAPRIGAVIVTVTTPSGKPLAAGLSVLLDDEPVPLALLGERRPANPGRHTVRVRADGFEPAEARVDVKIGAATPVTFALVPQKAAAPAPPQTSADQDVGPLPEQPPPTLIRSRTPAYVALGLGGVGVTVGVVAGIVALGKHGSLKDSCRDGCPPGSQSSIDSYRTAGAVSTVGFVVGGVGLASGAALFLLGPSAGAKAPTAGATIRPYLGATGIGASGSF